MPILREEPSKYPDDLWQGDGEAADPRHPWWCLHTKPRQEKATARYLRDHRLTYYLPQVVQVSRTPKGRKLRAVVPMFTGYVFLRGDDYHRIEALKSNHIVQVLTVGDQERLIRDLRQIDVLLRSGLSILSEPKIPVGTQVRILSGPLTGLTGTVIRRETRERFLAIVDFLSRGASVELEDWQVERLPG